MVVLHSQISVVDKLTHSNSPADCVLHYANHQYLVKLHRYDGMYSKRICLVISLNGSLTFIQRTQYSN